MSKITRSTQCSCSIRVVDPSDREIIIPCDEQLRACDAVVYQHISADGGYYALLDANGSAIGGCNNAPVPLQSLCGGTVDITDACASVVVGPKVSIYKFITSTVGELIDSADTVEGLYDTLAKYNLNADDTQCIVDMYLAANAGVNEDDVAYTFGNGLKYDAATRTVSVDTTNVMEKDNTKPITSAGVFVTVGNIEAILKTI